MSNQQNALRLALEALKNTTPTGFNMESDKKFFAAIKALEEALAKQEQGEPVAFKIYKPTPPRGAIPNVLDAELPWVYDQDPSSGNVASMWVTPVQTLRSKS
jgi:hypothetical protein